MGRSFAVPGRAGCDGGARRARSARSAGVPIAGPRVAAEPRLSQYGKFSPGGMTKAMDLDTALSRCWGARPAEAEWSTLRSCRLTR